MGFPFVYVCDLLDKLEAIHVRDVALLPKDRTSLTHDGIVSWFRTHQWRINANDTDDMAVLLTLKPEKQTDRDYGLEGTLEQILGRIFKLSTARYEHLKSWRDDAHNQGDLGSRLCNILEEIRFAPFRSNANKIMVEQIDQALLRIAIFGDRSSPALKSLKQAGEQAPDRIEVLESLYMQLQPREAKWLTRIIQKSYGPVTLPNDFGIGGNYTRLPNCLQVNVELLSSGPMAVRRDGYAVRRGVGSSEPSHPLPTPPTSSPLAPVQEHVAVATKPPRRYLLTLDPTSSALAPPVKISGPPTPAKSSPIPSSSVTKSTTAADLHLPPTPTKSSPLPSLSVTKTTRTDEGRLPPTSAKSSPLLSSSRKSGKEISKARSWRRSSTSHPPISRFGGSQSNQPAGPRRIALGTISSNIPSGRSQHSQQKSQENDATLLPNLILQNPTLPPVTFSTGKCTLTSSSTAKRCRFSNTILILSPCLLNTPYILETLIPSHGAHYIASLSALSHSTVPRRTKSGKRIRKFILVEVNRPEKTVQFCKAAEGAVRRLGWKCDRGIEERIPIFDWRVLESFRKVDNGEELGYEPLKKHFQGAI